MIKEEIKDVTKISYNHFENCVTIADWIHFYIVCQFDIDYIKHQCYVHGLTSFSLSLLFYSKTRGEAQWKS